MQNIRDPKFSRVAISCQRAEPNDDELKLMIDDAIRQIYGPEGLRALVKPGDHVTIKTNVVCCWQGARGEKGRGVITDPRIVRYVAEQIREIIGYNNGSELKVVDAVFTPDPNPSGFDNAVGFHYARLNRVPDNAVHEEDVTYDYNGDGILDGTSGARLVNVDAIDGSGRDLHIVELANGRRIPVAFPRFLRTRAEAEAANDGGDWTDVFIGMPVFKNHGFIGCTGSLKLHYGLRDLRAWFGDTGRRGHSGMYSARKDGTFAKADAQLLCDYLTAQHKIRTYDFVLMDCLTANRRGPCSPTGAVSMTPDPDEAVDYFMTNAILASKDAVAIDTVESTLGGYRYESIPLPRTAAENGVGVADAAYIEVDGMERFARHRDYLVRTYGPTGQYPLSSMGDPDVVEDPRPRYSVSMDSFTTEPDADGLHHVKYTVHPAEGCADPQIRRVDLYVFGALRQSNIGSELSGEFTFKHSDYDCFNGGYVVGVISAWDDMFNCVNSSTEFFIPPDGFED